MSDVKPTCLIIQPGAMGDIFVVAPIAKYYHDKGYLVYWPVRETYFNLVKNYFPYVHATVITDEKFPKLHSDWLRSDTMHLEKIAHKFRYDLVLNLADRGAEPRQLPNETFEEYKYREAGVPFAYKNHLNWERDIDKEKNLARHYFLLHPKKEFVLAHLSSSHGDKAEIPKEEKRSIVEIEPVKDFEIPVWYTLMLNASAIYCVESSVQQFVDGVIHRLKYIDPDKEFYLLSRSSLAPGESYTVSENWSKKYMK